MHSAAVDIHMNKVAVNNHIKINNIIQDLKKKINSNLTTNAIS